MLSHSEFSNYYVEYNIIMDRANGQSNNNKWLHFYIALIVLFHLSRMVSNGVKGHDVDEPKCQKPVPYLNPIIKVPCVQWAYVHDDWFAKVTADETLLALGWWLFSIQMFILVLNYSAISL